jgi:hypothetical protein
MSIPSSIGASESGKHHEGLSPKSKICENVFALLMGLLGNGAEACPLFDENNHSGFNRKMNFLFQSMF